MSTGKLLWAEAMNRLKWLWLAAAVLLLVVVFGLPACTFRNAQLDFPAKAPMLVSFTWKVSAQDDSGDPLAFRTNPKTDSVYVIARVQKSKTGELFSLKAKAPHISGATALVCFHVADTQLQTCFYRHDADGEVLQLLVPTTLTES